LPASSVPALHRTAPAVHVLPKRGLEPSRTYRLKRPFFQPEAPRRTNKGVITGAGIQFNILHDYRESVYYFCRDGVAVIVSFGDRATEDLYHGYRTSRVRRFPPNVMRVAVVKLDLLNAAAELNDLRSPPGNRLEALKGDLAGSYSIRVNDKWRIVFRWEHDSDHGARVVDYHG